MLVEITAVYRKRDVIIYIIISFLINIKRQLHLSYSIDFTTMPGNKYTTTEQDTGKKWVNGKSIYQKSITFNTTGSGAEETGANNENFSYIDTLISLDAILNMPNGERYPNSYTNPSAPSLQYFQLKFANWNNAQVLRYQTRSVGTVTMTILYTKK